MSADTQQRMIESAQRVLARAEAQGNTGLARVQRESIALLRALKGKPAGVFQDIFSAADVPSNWGVRVNPAGRNVDTRDYK